MRKSIGLYAVLVLVCGWICPKLVQAAEVPVLSPIPDQSIELGEVFTYDVDATGDPAPQYFLVVGAPTGMTIDSSTEVISWHPTHHTTIGWREVRVRAINSAGYDQTSFILEATRPVHRIEISSTEGGSVTTPGEGTFDYTYGDVVSFVATPDPNYRFVGWSGTTADRLVCPACPSVEMWIAESGTLVAQFEYIKAWHSLAVSSTEGGSVLQPGEGSFTYPEGSVVTLIADHDDGWVFHSWTGSMVDAGQVANPSDGFTTITIDRAGWIEANFVRFGTVPQYRLAVRATAGGDTYPVPGTFLVFEGTQVSIHAYAMEGYRFVNWTGAAAEAGAVADPTSASTILSMDADYTLTANFEVGGPPGPIHADPIVRSRRVRSKPGGRCVSIRGGQERVGHGIG